jgi:hypothetical protein
MNEFAVGMLAIVYVPFRDVVPDTITEAPIEKK